MAHLIAKKEKANQAAAVTATAETTLVQGILEDSFTVAVEKTLVSRKKVWTKLGNPPLIEMGLKDNRPTVSARIKDNH